ncbi:DNA endonuclease rbbp8 [Allomyces arbusculus]|nr:DNA endonuclease rbbp8 [Allomyces arbusculus]
MMPAAAASLSTPSRAASAAPRLLATPPALPAVPTTTSHDRGNDARGIDLMLDDGDASFPAPTARIDAAAIATEQALTSLAEHVRRAQDEARATVAQLAADHAQHVATLSADLVESRDRERMLQDEVRRMILETQAMSASVRPVGGGESQAAALMDEVEALRRQLAESRQAHERTTKELEESRLEHVCTMRQLAVTQQERDETRRELDTTRRQRDDAAQLAGKTNADLKAATTEVHQLRATLTQKRKLVESIGAELAHRKEKYKVVKHDLLTTTDQLRAAVAARDRYMHANTRLGKAFRVIGDHLGRPAVRALLAGAGLSINSDAPEAPERAVVSAEPEPAPAPNEDVEMQDVMPTTPVAADRRPPLPNMLPNPTRTNGVTRLVLSQSPPLAPAAPPSDIDLDAAGIAFDLDSEGPMHPLGQPARPSDPVLSSQTQDTIGHPPPAPRAGRPSSPIRIEDDEDEEVGDVTVCPPGPVRARSAPASTPTRPPSAAPTLPSPAAPTLPSPAAPTRPSPTAPAAPTGTAADDDSPRPRKRRAVVDPAAGTVLGVTAAAPEPRRVSPPSGPQRHRTMAAATFAAPSPAGPQRHRTMATTSPTPSSAAPQRHRTTAATPARLRDQTLTQMYPRHLAWVNDDLDEQHDVPAPPRPPPPPPAAVRPSAAAVSTPMRRPTLATPSRTSTFAPHPSAIKYSETVRSKTARQAMHASDCACCATWYTAVAPPPPADNATTAPDVAAHRHQVSRHRSLFPPPSTPDEFWEMGFPSTQESELSPPVAAGMGKVGGMVGEARSSSPPVPSPAAVVMGQPKSGAVGPVGTQAQPAVQIQRKMSKVYHVRKMSRAAVDF